MATVPGNPWWSEPGWTLDRIPKDRTREPAGRHADRRSAPGSAGSAPAPRHARPGPQPHAEPDQPPATPVRTPHDRPAAAYWAARSEAPAWHVWIAQRLAALRPADHEAGEAGTPHPAAALRRLAAARRGLDRENSGPSLGPAVGSVADGTASADALHGTGRDEGPVRAEGNTSTEADRHTGSASSRPGHRPDARQTERKRDLREQSE